MSSSNDKNQLPPVEKVVPIRPDMSNSTSPRPKGSKKGGRLPIRTKPRRSPPTPKDEEQPVLAPMRRLANGLTLRQDSFCHAYVETGNGSEAYRRSYTTTNMKEATVTNNAYMLLKRSDIQARVAAIREVLAKRVLVTVESLTEELDEARKLAIEKGIPAAAISATAAKAKLHGFMVEKIEQTSTQFVVEAPKQDDSTEEWLAAVTPKAG